MPRREQASVNLHHNHFYTTESYSRHREPWIRREKGHRSKPQLLSPLRWPIYLLNSVDKNENFARLHFKGHLLPRSLADDTVDTEKIWIRD